MTKILVWRYEINLDLCLSDMSRDLFIIEVIDCAVESLGSILT
jgi:hypothetical protein